VVDGLVGLFATAFAGLAVPGDQAGNDFLEFSKLPSRNLIDLGKQAASRRTSAMQNVLLSPPHTWGSQNLYEALRTS